VPGSNAFVIALPEEMRAELSQYVELLDVSRQGHPITLRYLKASQLLANLPPSVSAGQIVPTGMPEVVFFRGSSASLDAFKRELSIIDRPRPQIRYELLIVQYEESDRLSTETTTTGRRYDGRAEQGILGQVGSLLSLNFDIISTFGYQFAVDLTAQLANQEARVLADTTLNGLSGEKLSFRNTSTFRFREPETDSDTEETRNTGVVTEITSGLILTVNGWTSGDGMITMDVSATVSKRVNADTGARDELPGTSERVVNTHVRTESGKPVIISGLLQQETNLSETKVPILGDIPILGRLFRSSTESVDTTELAIYIVPHVERSPDEEAHIGRAFETMYRRHREAR
jgi:type II secretory pathway component GspD/PulD (secretin)